MGTDTELMSQLMTKHQTVMSILSSRQATLQVVRGFWAQGDARGALSAMLQSAGMHPGTWTTQLPIPLLAICSFCER